MRLAVCWSLVLVIGGPAACAHKGVDRLTPAHREIILGAVLASLDRSLPSNAPICLAVARDNDWADADTTASWTRSARRRVIPRTQCPPTYQTMVQVVDSAGRPILSERPPGYIDPYYVTLWGPVRLARDLYVVRYRHSQGAGGVLGLCEIHTSSTPVRATCTVTSHFVS